MRADQLLPDHVDSVDVRGVTIHKGTVTAFLANARIWSDRASGETARERAAADIVEALAALRASGLFDVLTIIDPALRAWIDAQPLTCSLDEVQR
ncbi:MULTISPECIES: hypothetical protein [Paraburkholderia]|jgi:hypothetical protein|uniref:Preprotein translocase subunit SecD n=1 Tax=Paraburkholderia strydomiana TaxID=1245417 RepID=A0ABW9C8B0_9BURK